MSGDRKREKFLKKLEKLIHLHEGERRKRFLPFYILLSGKTDHPEYAESLAVGRYFVENALLFTKEDEEFWRAVRDSLPPEQAAPETAATSLPLQDYLKVIYDLRDS